MNALDRLAQLHLVSEQNQILGRWRHRNQIRDRYLSRLVDEKVIELAAGFLEGKYPRCATDQVGEYRQAEHMGVGWDNCDCRVRRLSIFFAALRARKPDTKPVRRFARRLHQQTDRVVAVRRNCDPFSASQELRD